MYDTPSLGASGATVAMFAVYARFYPRAKLHVMFIPKAFPAGGILPVLIGVEIVWSAVSPNSGIAHWGHLGGAFFGLAYYALVLRHGKTPARLTHPAVPPRLFYEELQRMPTGVDQVAHQEALIFGAPSNPPHGHEGGAPPSSPSPLAGMAEAFKPRDSDFAARRTTKRSTTGAPWKRSNDTTTGTAAGKRRYSTITVRTPSMVKAAAAGGGGRSAPIAKRKRQTK